MRIKPEARSRFPEHEADREERELLSAQPDIAERAG
jgi:hypothetical protein